MDKILKKTFDLETIEFLEKNDAILAGGSLRSYYKNTNIIDFDFYFKNKETFDKVQKFFRKKYEKFFDYESNSSVTFKINEIIVQILRPYFGEPKEIINHFDFNVFQAYYDIKNKSYFYSGNFVKGISENKLCFSENYKYYFSCFHRLLKYKNNYGFIIDQSIKDILLKEYENLDLIDNTKNLKKYINGEDYKSFDLLLENFNISKESFDIKIFKEKLLNFINEL